MPGTITISPLRETVRCLESDSFYVDGKPGYTGSNGDWERVEVPLPAAYRTSDFRVRFVYSTGVSVPDTDQATSMAAARPGWYLDDLSFESD